MSVRPLADGSSTWFRQLVSYCLLNGMGQTISMCFMRLNR